MERDITIFRDLVQTKTPIQVYFEIDGTFIPVVFTLRRGSLKLDPTLGRDACIHLKFGDFVDIFDYYWSTHRSNCPQLSHEDFFNISNVVAALYGTQLIVSLDASYKDINGFRVESEVLSMTKPEGRTFYGKYGLISPLAPAYKAAAKELKQEADDLIHRITTFDGDETAREQLNQERMQFYKKVKSKIEEHTDFIGEDTPQKEPTLFQTLRIVNADNIPVEAGTKPSIIKIIAFTHTGGSKRKRSMRKRTKKVKKN